MALSKIKPASQEQYVGRRNHIINGSFQVWQRSEDNENTGNGWAYRTVDRFQSNKGRYRKTTDTVDGRTVDVLRIDPSSGVYNGNRGFFTMIEDYHVYDKPTVLSVWVKADAATTATLGLLWDYGTSTAVGQKTINVTTSWQRFEIAYSAQTFTQAAAHYILNGLQDGRTYYVAMAQLEDGDKATPFEHARSYAEELSLCQRYCIVFKGTTGNLGCIAVAHQTDSDDTDFAIHCPVPLRTKPTITSSSTRIVHSGGGETNCSLYNIYQIQNLVGMNWDSPSTPFGADQAAQFRIDDGGSLKFDAEL